LEQVQITPSPPIASIGEVQTSSPADGREASRAIARIVAI